MENLIDDVVDKELNTVDFWNHTGTNEVLCSDQPCDYVHNDIYIGNKAYRPRTGDLIFFSGNNDSSQIIKYFTVSEWSHVAMVVQNATNGVFYTFESTSEIGVVLNPLNDRLRSYKGYCCVRNIKRKLHRRQLMRLSKYINRNMYRPFDTHYQNWLDTILEHWTFRSSFVQGMMQGATMRGVPPLNKRGDGIICSELVINALKQMDIKVDCARPACTYVPEDLSQSSTVYMFNINSGYLYGPEFRLRVAS